MYRVLLVLDSEDLSAVLCKELSSDFEVNVCDATTAVEMIDHYQPDVLILDLFLPGTDGFQILQNANYNTPSRCIMKVQKRSESNVLSKPPLQNCRK